MKTNFREKQVDGISIAVVMFHFGVETMAVEEVCEVHAPIIDNCTTTTDYMAAAKIG